MKFATQYTVIEKKQFEKKTPGLPSLTIPDEVLTIPEIIKRFSSGLGTNVNVPIYTGDNDILEGINPETLDLVEKYNILRTAESNYSKRRKELDDELQAKQKAEFDRIVAEEVERRLKDKAPQA